MHAMTGLMIYGANGYTGELTARFAAEAGIKATLAGRSPEKVEAVAARFGFPHVAVALDDARALRAALEPFDVVLHCAGPFSRTSAPMVDACIASKTHYLDITGEIDVFEACHARDADAQKAGVMVLPGTGFDVVPSDCLAQHVHTRFPEATDLVLAFMGTGSTSHGTAMTMVENLGQPSAVRRDGVITPCRLGTLTREVDFGEPGVRFTLGIPWGDVSTAYYSTQIPNIEVYTAVPPKAAKAARLLASLGPVLKSRPVQRLLKSRVDAAAAGPSDTERARANSYLYAEASRGKRRVRSRLTTPEGYTLTAHASLAIAKRVLADDFKPGFQTPSLAYGADLVMQLPGVSREDLDELAEP